MNDNLKTYRVNKPIPGEAMRILETTTCVMACWAAFEDSPNRLSFSSVTGMPCLSSLRHKRKDALNMTYSLYVYYKWTATHNITLLFWTTDDGLGSVDFYLFTEIIVLSQDALNWSIVTVKNIRKWYKCSLGERLAEETSFKILKKSYWPLVFEHI